MNKNNLFLEKFSFIFLDEKEIGFKYQGVEAKGMRPFFVVKKMKNYDNNKWSNKFLLARMKTNRGTDYHKLKSNLFHLKFGDKDSIIDFNDLHILDQNVIINSNYFKSNYKLKKSMKEQIEICLITTFIGEKGLEKIIKVNFTSNNYTISNFNNISKILK